VEYSIRYSNDRVLDSQITR